MSTRTSPSYQGSSPAKRQNKPLTPDWLWLAVTPILVGAVLAGAFWMSSAGITLPGASDQVQPSTSVTPSYGNAATQTFLSSVREQFNQNQTDWQNLVQDLGHLFRH